MAQTNLTLIKILEFPVTKIIIGIIVVAGSVVLVEWGGRLLLNPTSLSDEVKNLIIAITESFLALFSYVLLFKFYEKRRIEELNAASFGKNASLGFLTGLILQSLFIFVLYLSHDYSIIRVNPFSSLLPAFSFALTAGFVAELLILGVAYRLIEEKLGTIITLIIFSILFAIFHLGAKGATLVSIIASGVQAGLLLSSSFVLTRKLWFPIFFHFAWDFVEPGIYGAINPANSIEQSLFTSKINGPKILTGGLLGPQNSIQSIVICLAASLIFLWLAKKKNNFVKPYWKR